jgi:alpha-tubulin suppressor-like RCC1 family protein
LSSGWGDNTYGQLGKNGTLIGNFSRPTQIDALAQYSVIRIAADGYSALFLTSSGRLITLGSNAYGQLGNSSISASSAFEPVLVDQSELGFDITDIRVSSGVAMYALTRSGDLWAWGYTFLEYPTGQKFVPFLVTTAGSPLNGEKVAQYGVTSSSGAILTPSGKLLSWGSSFLSGAGRAGQTFPISPTDFGSMINTNVSQLACGRVHTLALAENGTQVYGWGYSATGSLTDPLRDSQFVLSPTLIVTSSSSFGGAKIKKVESGDATSFALTENGIAWSWGICQYYEAGQTDRSTCWFNVQQVPRVGQLSGLLFVDIEVGANFVVALMDDGNLYSWGSASGYLGTGVLESSSRAAAARVNMTSLVGKTIKQISAHTKHVIVLATDGSLFGWGENFYGEVGVGDRLPQLSPVPLSTEGLQAGGTIIKISTGKYHTVALSALGTIYTCGYNDNYGVLGYNIVTAVLSRFLQPIFETIENGILFNNFTDVAAGESHTVALTREGAVVAWGRGDYGALGILDNLLVHMAAPNPVNADGFSALAANKPMSVFAGQYRSFALTAPLPPVAPSSTPSATLTPSAPHLAIPAQLPVEPPQSSPSGPTPAVASPTGDVLPPSNSPSVGSSTPRASPAREIPPVNPNGPTAASSNTPIPSSTGIAPGAVAGIVIGICLLAAIIGGVAAYLIWRRRQATPAEGTSVEMT